MAKTSWQNRRPDRPRSAMGCLRADAIKAVKDVSAIVGADRIRCNSRATGRTRVPVPMNTKAAGHMPKARERNPQGKLALSGRITKLNQGNG